MRLGLANTLSYFVYIVRFLRRNRSIRSIIRSVAILLLLGFIFFPAITALILRFGVQLSFGMMFMVVQFGALFWFLSRSKTITILPGDKTGLTLLDYKGQPALVNLMGEWISILQGDANFYQMGGISPSGLVLTGEPGTGKTWLAKCTAGSAGVAMHGIEGSGFRAMFMGMDVLKTMTFVNKCRRLAAEHGACIAFIDEIDALGSRGGMGGMGMM